jgi:hypothetical protein
VVAVAYFCPSTALALANTLDKRIRRMVTFSGTAGGISRRTLIFFFECPGAAYRFRSAVQFITRVSGALEFCPLRTFMRKRWASAETS